MNQFEETEQEKPRNEGTKLREEVAHIDLQLKNKITRLNRCLDNFLFYDQFKKQPKTTLENTIIDQKKLLEILAEASKQENEIEDEKSSKFYEENQQWIMEEVKGYFEKEEKEEE